VDEMRGGQIMENGSAGLWTSFPSGINENVLIGKFHLSFLEPELNYFGT